MKLDPVDARIRDEIDHHIAELEQRLVAEGLGPDEARAEALRRFGNPDEVGTATRRARAGAGSRLRAFGRALRQDLAFAVRQLLRQPGTGGLVIVTLVVGVAATSVVYSVVHAVVLAPLPFEDPDRLVQVNQTSPQGRLYGMSEPNYVDFRNRLETLSELAAIGYGNPVLSGEGDAEAVEGMRITHNLLETLGMTPVLGRGFTAGEDRYGGANAVALLSEGIWLRRFGGDEAVLGRTLLLDGEAHQIVGVIASDRAWPGVQIFTPLAPNPDVYRDDQRLQAVGRLRPGVTLAQVDQDLGAVAAELSAEYPESNDRWGASARPVREWLVGPSLTRLGWFLLGVVGLFLLMACASVSNLLLARATVRMEEMSIRAALGAGRRRLAGQLVTEAGVLALTSCVLGVLLAHLALRVVQAAGPADVARLSEATVGAPVLAVTTGAAALTVLLAGLAPGGLLLRTRLFAGLRAGRGVASPVSRRVRGGLVVFQFALAVTVLLSAGLLIRSFERLQAVELGFRPSGVVRFGIRLPDGQFSPTEREDYLRQLYAELEARPGVVSVGATSASPYTRFRPSNFVARSDREPALQQDFLPVSWRAVSGDYFAAAGIAVQAGRVFGPEDRFEPDALPENPPVVIDETLAETLWPGGESPVGELLTWFLPGGGQHVVIGVVDAARDENMDMEPRPRIYRPFALAGWDQPSVIVRVAGDPGQAIPMIRSTVRAIDPDMPAIAPTPMLDDVRESVAWPRFSMQVLSVFGAIALGLAVLGIYGITAFSVARRKQEIGLRVALGAAPSGVHWLVLRDAMVLAALGIGLGLVLSFIVTRFLGALLYEVSARDPLTFLIVPAALGAAALASAWLPARRAVSMDPREALVPE